MVQEEVLNRFHFIVSFVKFLINNSQQLRRDGSILSSQVLEQYVLDTLFRGDIHFRKLSTKIISNLTNK